MAGPYQADTTARLQVSDVDVSNSNPVPVSLAAGVSIGTQLGSVALMPTTASGPTLAHHLTSAATTNATNVKATAAVLTGGFLRNRAASERYFKIFNKATAPTIGTDTPVLTIGIAAGGQVTLGDVLGPYAWKLTAGLSYAITGAWADLDATAVAAADVDVNLIYI